MVYAGSDIACIILCYKVLLKNVFGEHTRRFSSCLSLCATFRQTVSLHYELFRACGQRHPVFTTVIERFEVKISMLRLFYENFEILSTAPGFVSLINYVLEVNLRWLTINHHSVQDVNDPVNHAQVCAGCNYEYEIIQKIKQYALHANLERRGFFYTRRAE